MKLFLHTPYSFSANRDRAIREWVGWAAAEGGGNRLCPMCTVGCARCFFNRHIVGAYLELKLVACACVHAGAKTGNYARRMVIDVIVLLFYLCA
jgi:hypothetical protein